jgi:hypothetical protein
MDKKNTADWKKQEEEENEEDKKSKKKFFDESKGMWVEVNFESNGKGTGVIVRHENRRKRENIEGEEGKQNNHKPCIAGAWNVGSMPCYEPVSTAREGCLPSPLPS